MVERPKELVEILERAAALLSQGWTRGVYARNVHGWPIDPTQDNATDFCAMGAIERGTFDLGIERGWSPCPLERRLRNACIGELSRQLYEDDGSGDVPRFNDDPGTTKEDVLGLYDRTIASIDGSAA